MLGFGQMLLKIRQQYRCKTLSHQQHGSVPEFPPLKNKDMPPFIQKLDASIWDTWPERNQKKFSRMIRGFKDNVKAMLYYEDEEDPEDHYPGVMLAAHCSLELADK
jgi:hypothetical protein